MKFNEILEEWTTSRTFAYLGGGGGLRGRRIRVQACAGEGALAALCAACYGVGCADGIRRMGFPSG